MVREYPPAKLTADILRGIIMGITFIYAFTVSPHKLLILVAVFLCAVFQTTFSVNFCWCVAIALWGSCHEQSLKKISESFMKLLTVGLLIIIALRYLGLLDELGMAGQGELRYTMGFWNANTFGVYLLILGLLGLLLQRRCFFYLAVVLYILTYPVHRSLTSLILLIFCLVLKFCFSGRLGILKLGAITAYLTGLLTLFLPSLDSYLLKHFHFNLDAFLSMRVSIAKNALIDEYGDKQLQYLFLGGGETCCDSGWLNLIYGIGLPLYLVVFVFLCVALKKCIPQTVEERRVFSSVLIVFITLAVGLHSEMLLQSWNIALIVILAFFFSLWKARIPIPKTTEVLAKEKPIADVKLLNSEG
jgi:hypothetical protein